MTRIFLTLLLCAGIYLNTGCATQAQVASTPGALSSFDLTSYNTLITAQASITAAKAQMTVTTPQATKDVLNTIIAAYNVAMTSYKTYHTALAAGGTPDSTALQAQIAGVVQAVAAFAAEIKGTIAPVTPSLAVPK